MQCATGRKASASLKWIKLRATHDDTCDWKSRATQDDQTVLVVHVSILGFRRHPSNRTSRTLMDPIYSDPSFRWVRQNDLKRLTIRQLLLCSIDLHVNLLSLRIEQGLSTKDDLHQKLQGFRDPLLFWKYISALHHLPNSSRLCRLLLLQAKAIRWISTGRSLHFTSVSVQRLHNSPSCCPQVEMPSIVNECQMLRFNSNKTLSNERSISCRFHSQVANSLADEFCLSAEFSLNLSRSKWNRGFSGWFCSSKCGFCALQFTLECHTWDRVSWNVRKNLKWMSLF